MADESILSDDLVRQLIAVGQVDLLVGLPTYNDAQTVGQVVQVIRAGLLKYFPRERAAILNADGGSQDETPSLVKAASISDARNAAALRSLRTLHCISTHYSGNPSRATALHTIVAAADLLQAKACAVIAPESSNIEPGWVDRLLRPVCRQDFDFVGPVYRRHKFEGMLVTNLLYPMTRAIYNWPVREPYPAEFAFSGRFGNYLVGHEMWREEACRAGAEICFTSAALAGGFRFDQTFLGPKGNPEQSAPDLVPAMRQTVGTLFWSLDQYFGAWSAAKEAKPSAALEPKYEFTTEAVKVNRERLYQMFRTGVAELAPVLSSILSPATLEELKRLAALEEPQFQYSDELWVKTIYEFAASYHRSVISRDHIIQSLVPLYRGRACAFLLQNQEACETEVERHIENLCLTFERLKPYLLELWSGEKRRLVMREMIFNELSQATHELVHEFAHLLPRLLVMLIIVAAGWLVAYLVKIALRSTLRLLKFDRFSEDAGAAQLLNKAALPSSTELVSRLVFWVVLLGFILLGINALGVMALEDDIARFFLFLPRLFVAVLILFFGMFASSFFSRAALLAAVNANLRSARILGYCARAIIVVLALSMAFEELGIAENTILAAFSIVFGALMLGLAIAFGLGGRDLARQFLERRFSGEKMPANKEDELSPL